MWHVGGRQTWAVEYGYLGGRPILALWAFVVLSVMGLTVGVDQSIGTDGTNTFQLKTIHFREWNEFICKTRKNATAFCVFIFIFLKLVFTTYLHNAN